MVRKSGSKSFKNKCAPSRISKGDAKITCYSKDSLVKMAKSYNEHVGKKSKGGSGNKRRTQKTGASGLVNNFMNLSGKVDTNNEVNIYKGGRISWQGKNKKQIWEQLSSRLFNRCGNDDMCWADQGFVKNLGDKQINDKTFRPKMPESWKKNPNEWLNTTNINNVMRQYEDAYDDFIYLGTVPRDCPMGVSCHISDIDLGKLYKKHGVKKVGMVYNLDLHNQSGSHWVAVYMDLDKGIATYFDSYADKPPKLIFDFMKKCMTQMKEVGVDMKYQMNQRRHQYGGSECGVYSCYFLIKSLEGKSLKQFSARRVADSKMTAMRKHLFVA